MGIERRGFGSLSPEQLKAVSRKGGMNSNPRKGWGSLTPEERRANGQRAYQARKEKQSLAENSQTVDSEQPTNT
jgi:hypothetical protein